MSNVRPTLIAYTTKTKGISEFDKFRVTYFNPTFFQRPCPKGKYDYFYTESEEIREQYRLQNPIVKEYKLESKDKPKRTARSIESQVKDNLSEKKDAEQEQEEESAVQEQAEEVTSNESDSEASDEQDKPEIPDDYADLSWPKLRSLASQFSDEKGINKERALEILAEAKGE